MSLVSRSVLIGSILISGGTITYVHVKQFYDREQLHLGVVRDIERQERRKAENIYILQQQQELTKQLKREFEEQQDTVIKNKM